jgi:opacity protein-like surface antigen
MKKLYLTIPIIILYTIIFSSQGNAQISFQIGGGLGYSLPMGDYGGTTMDFYNGTKYGMESGFNLHAKARFNLLVIGGFTEFGYTSFSGSGEAEPEQGNIDISHKLFSIKVGPEFHISIPASPVTPYALGFVSYNHISGDVEFQGVSNVPSGKYDLATASRIGLGAGAGILFSLGGINLDVNIQYHFINIGGKEYKIEDITSHEILDSYTSLNDGRDPLYNVNSTGHFIENDRGISALEFKLSIMFGLL